MASTIPASQLVNVIPSVLASQGKALDLNGMVGTKSWRVPIGTVSSFPDAPSVLRYFGPGNEYTVALPYFKAFTGATKTPGALLFFQSPPGNGSSAYLLGGSVAAYTITQLQAISGSLTVTIDGQTFTAGSLDFTGANSFSDAAATIQTGLGASDATFTASIAPTTTTCNGTISGDTMLLSGAGAPKVFVGSQVTGTGVTAGTTVIDFQDGTGGKGSYTISPSQNVASTVLTITNGLMTVTAVAAGVIQVGAMLQGTSVDPTTQLVGRGTGTGSTGTYYVNPPQTVGSTAITNASAVVTYDSVSGGFLITSGSRGSAVSKMTVATGTASASLKLTTATGAILSQGGDFQNGFPQMAAVANISQNWAAFTTAFTPTQAQAQGYAKWADSTFNRFAYVLVANDAAMETTPDTTSAASKILAAGYGGTVITFAGNILAKAGFVLGYPAALDFGAKNGRATLAYRTQTGLGASVTDAVSAANLKANGYNFLGSYGGGNGNFTNFQPGTITGPFAWADTYFNQIWLNNSLQRALITLLMNVKSVPYNRDGYGLIRGACADPITAALNFGAIRAGVSLSEEQAQEVQAAAGQDISAPLQTVGYYLQILDPSADVRAQRGTPPINLWYMDGESVQNISLASIVIQ